MPNTQDNLKEAFAGESQANRKYLAFAKKAEADGRPGIARLFRAAAEAETVHAHADLREAVRLRLLRKRQVLAVRLALAGERRVQVVVGSHLIIPCSVSRDFPSNLARQRRRALLCDYTAPFPPLRLPLFGCFPLGGRPERSSGGQGLAAIPGMPRFSCWAQGILLHYRNGGKSGPLAGSS